MQNRRQFISASATAVLAASTPRLLLGQPVSGTALASTKDDLFSNAHLGGLRDGLFTEARLQALIGTLFMVFVEDLEVDYMRLREVRSYTSGKTPGSASPVRNTRAPGATQQTVLQQFTLIFSNQNPLPAQGSYVVDHGRLGRFTLFLVPGATASGEPRSMAYFNVVLQNSVTRPIRQ